MNLKLINMKNLLYIVLICTLLFSCTRKLHTEKTVDTSSATQAHKIDSISQVNKTLSEAYEELLKVTNSTGVVFESIPCDSAKIGGSGMPHVINKVTVSPDGTKTFEGNIKSYKDDATKYQRTIFSMQETIDSLNSVIKSDTSHHEQSHTEIIRTVKSTFIPIWLWIVLAIVGALWLNERLSIFKIPFITRTSLFKSNKQS